MTHILEEWRYTEDVPHVRREKHLMAGSFERMIELVAEDASKISTRLKPNESKRLPESRQVVFSFSLPNVGDAFFNGPYGYRAQYYLSAARGLAANAQLISSMREK